MMRNSLQATRFLTTLIRGICCCYILFHRRIIRSNVTFVEPFSVRTSCGILHSEDRASWYTCILTIKPTKYTNFSNLFWNRTLHVSDSFSVHHQESSTVHTAIDMSYRFCWLLASGIPLASSQQNLYDIYTYLLLCVQCWTPVDGQRNCPKHVEFYYKINLRN